MKKTIALLIVGLFSLMLVSPINSATESGNIAVTATVQAGTPAATFVIRKAPDGGNIDFTPLPAPLTAMNFDRFTITQMPSPAIAQWISADHFVVIAYTNGMGRQYKIQSTGSGSFTKGADTLPAGSFACIPVYAEQDMWDLDNDGTPDTAQGVKPAAAVKADPFKALNGGIWSDVYTSENPGSARIIQVRYAFPPFKTDGNAPYLGYAPIPTSQPSGTYSGVTVRVRITAI